MYVVTLLVSVAVVFVSGHDASDVTPEDCGEVSVNLFQFHLALEESRRSTERGTVAEPQGTSKPTNWNGRLVALNSTALAHIDTWTEQPLFSDFERAPFEQMQFAIASSPNVSMADWLLCKSYHKTGTEVCREFLTARTSVTHENYFRCDYENCTNGIKAGAVLYQQPDVNVWRSLRNAPFRMIHFIRKPHDIIISGFRYHMSAPETWCLQPEMCMGCSRADHDAIFSLCAENCTYTDLLRSVAAVNESAGVIVEALNERHNIAQMLKSTFQHANDAQVLHLSVDHLKKDFGQTMQCINTFLGGKGLQPEQLQVFESFNPESDRFMQDRHVTTGKYNNTLIKQFLLSHPAWGPEFEAANNFMNRLFQRQASALGCPIP